MKIYISGPKEIGGGAKKTKECVERSKKIEAELNSQGYQAVNSVEIAMKRPDLEPEEYMRVCIALMSVCDAAFFLEGWEASKECEIEFEYAYEHKMTIGFERGKE